MRKTAYFCRPRLFKVMVAMAMTASAMTVSAQSSALDFKQVYQAALEQDATIRASRAAADSGRERLPQAKAALMPQISASAGRSSNNLDTTAPNILGNLSTTNDKYFSDSKSVQLRQPLMNMQRWLQFEQAKSQVAEVGPRLTESCKTWWSEWLAPILKT